LKKIPATRARVTGMWVSQVMSLTLGIKYCGHCQPRRNMFEFMERLCFWLKDVEFIGWDKPGDYAHLLILNACSVQCARVPEFGGTVIFVSDQGLNFQEYDQEEDLLQAVADLINNLTVKTEKGIAGLCQEQILEAAGNSSSVAIPRIPRPDIA
jgi:hypothetical protein